MNSTTEITSTTIPTLGSTTTDAESAPVVDGAVAVAQPLPSSEVVGADSSAAFRLGGAPNRESIGWGVLAGARLPEDSPWNGPVLLQRVVAAGLAPANFDTCTSIFLGRDIIRERLPVITPVADAKLPSGKNRIRRVKQELSALDWLYPGKGDRRHYRAIQAFFPSLQGIILELAKVAGYRNILANSGGDSIGRKNKIARANAARIEQKEALLKKAAHIKRAQLFSNPACGD